MEINIELSDNLSVVKSRLELISLLSKLVESAIEQDELNHWDIHSLLYLFQKVCDEGIESLKKIPY